MAASAFRGTCYPDLASALQANCEQAYPLDGSDGAGNVYHVQCLGVGATYLTLQRSTAAGVEASSSLEVSYPECDPAAIGSAVMTPEMAGAAFSWAFSAVIVFYLIAWGAQRVLRVIGR